MKKNNAWLWWLLGLSMLAIIVYFIYRYAKLPNILANKLTGEPIKSETGSPLTDYGDIINTHKALYYGDKSNSVIRLQQAINEMITKYGYSYTKLAQDGVFGNKTLDAIRFISNSALGTGVTVNDIYNLPKLNVSGSLNHGTSGGNLGSVITYTGA